MTHLHSDMSPNDQTASQTSHRVSHLIARLSTHMTLNFYAVVLSDTVDYSPAFYAMEICMVLTIVTIFVFHLHVSLPEKAHIGQLFKV